VATRRRAAGHVLENVDARRDVAHRLKRAHGQLSAVIRMLDEGRACEEIVTQIAAASKAINGAAFTLVSAGLEECITQGGKASDDATERLRRVFLALA